MQFLWRGLTTPPAMGWRLTGRLFVLVFVFVSAVVLRASSTTTAAPLRHSAVRAAVRALLLGQGTAGPGCSALIFADHTATARALVEGVPEGYAEGGTTLLQLPPSVNDDRLANTTGIIDELLQELMKIGRKMRFTTRCLTVVFVTDSPAMLAAMLEHSTDDRLMLWETHGVVVTSLPESTALPVVESKWAFTMMNTHLLLLPPDPSVHHKSRVYRYEPFSPEGRRTRQIGLYTPQEGLVFAVPIHYEKYDNFFGGAVNFSVLTYMPFVEVTVTELKDGTKQHSFIGMDYEVMLALSELLNFEPTYIDGPTTWAEVEQTTMDRHALIVPCSYFVMLSVLETFDFIAPYVTLDLSFAMHQPSKISNWDNFLKPFVANMWLFTFGILLLVSLCLVLVLEFSNLEFVKSSKLRGGKQHGGSTFKVSKSQAVFEVFGAVVGQDFNIQMPHTHSFRILITAFFTFIIVLSTGYKSELISYMTSPNKPFRPETLKELVDSNALITYPPWGHYYRTLLEASTTREHKIIAERYAYVDSMVTGLKMAKEEGSAHVDIRRFESMTIAEYYMRADGSSDYYIGRESVLSLLGSIPIPHDAPYKPQFDRVMLNLVQGGLYKKWYDDMIEIQRMKVAAARDRNPDGTPVMVFSSNEARVEPLTLDNLQGPFWIFLCGSMLATTVFLVELMIDKLSKGWRTSVSDLEHGTLQNYGN